MKRHDFAPIVALLLTLVLLLPLAAPAEDAISTETEALPDGEGLFVFGEDAEESPGDAVEDLLVPAVDTLPTGSSEDISEVAPQPTLKASAVSNAVPGQITLGVKEKYTLKASDLAPYCRITYKSSKKKVATVSQKGVVTAKKKGTAKIRCYADGVLLTSCKVTVVAAPKKVSLGRSKLTIGLNETRQLTPTIPKGTHTKFSWSSKNKSIVKVSGNGQITGMKQGKTTITVKTHNGHKAKLTVTVKAGNTPAPTISPKPDVAPTATPAVKGTAKPTATPAPDPYADASVKYRALLIGEVNYQYDRCIRNRASVSAMAEMLKSVRGLYGGSYSITKEYDLTSTQILNSIKNTFATADENDVSLFYVACHGDISSSGDAAGALDTCSNDKLKINRLADALSAVPGKVIVILESCGSGAAIYSNGISRQEAMESAMKAFDVAVVKAFSEADPGIEVEIPANGVNTSGIQSNTGELRVENKFYVLTAASYQELSWGMEYDYYNEYYNFFTTWLTDGIGTSGHMPADTNFNGQTTLDELYTYIAKEGNDYPIVIGGWVYYQHVQVYPSGSDYVLFKR